jgi:NADP-reducing hydrogenase subunit HndC
VPQERVVLKHCGIIDPGDIETYLARGGFQALQKAQEEMVPQEIVAAVKASGLRGRGGAGFSCGLKWELARGAPGEEKFIIVNADESEMGTFKDRFLLQQDPFTLIEGLAIAARAIGATQAYIYLRAEYHRLLPGLDRALDQVRAKGFLGGLPITVFEGAGAYICGEESALMESIEGRRGEPRLRPPFPTTSGLWGRPTVIHNVETLMNLPAILNRGPARFHGLGTAESTGTKVFSISGDVARPDVYELVLGSTLRELVMDLAGAERVQAVQVGGAGGRLLPAKQLDTPLCFEAVLGSGGVVVFNETRDMVEVVFRSVSFLAEESCGQCTPCREGTEVLLEVLERMVRGDGAAGDLDTLQILAGVLADASLCGLGQSTSVLLRDALAYFRADFENRIAQAVYLRGLPAQRPA